MPHLMKFIAIAMSVLALESCYSYQIISFERKYAAEPRGIDHGGTSVIFRLPVRKYLVRMNSPSPVAVINNKAVDLSALGRFGEAEILFRDALGEDAGDAALFNNLAVICEAAGDPGEAFRMYESACRIMPQNPVFRQNFGSFADYRQGRN